MNDTAKLETLLLHWMEHNRDHVASYRDWAGRMRNEGIEAVADQLAAAAEHEQGLESIFQAALTSLRASRGTGASVPEPGGTT